MGRGSRLVGTLVALAAVALAAPAGAEGLRFEPATTTLAAALERAKPDGRLVLVDLVTPTCTWCRVLERETFPSPRVGEALGPTICVRVEAGSPTGADLVRRFGVRGYPTILFLDGDGREVDRVVGFLAADRFAAEVARIRRDDGTLRSLRRAHERDPAAPGPAVAYARRLVRVGETGPARALLTAVADATPGDPVERPAALLGLAELASRLSDDAGALAFASRVTDEFPSSPAAADAWLLRVQVHAGQGEVETALEEIGKARAAVRDDAAVVALETTAFWLHRRRTETTLVRWGERAIVARDADALHRAAQAALEARLVLGTALRWAEVAADLSGRDAEVLVTWAELLAETGNDEKGLAVAREAEGRVRDADVRERLKVVLARLLRCRAAATAERASRPDGAAGAERPADAAGGAPPAPVPETPRVPEPPPAPAPPSGEDCPPQRCSAPCGPTVPVVGLSVPPPSPRPPARCP